MVTGGAGFIGCNIVDALVKRGHEVAVVDNLSTGARENLSPRARFYQINIRDKGLDKAMRQEKPEVVSHHAAQASMRKSTQILNFLAVKELKGFISSVILELKYLDLILVLTRRRYHHRSLKSTVDLPPNNWSTS